MTGRPIRSLAPPGRRPWWAIAGLAAIAALALGLYTWSLARNGMANSYYAAAVKSASVSWKAFLFGSLDPGSFITIDKPPASIWLMAVFCRIFGFSSWSMLIPQALAGAASVLVLHHLVRRWAGDAAALLSALTLALTPVAVLIFRYNNPDALLTFLLLLSTWGLWSALESTSERGVVWRLALAGAALGLAFLTKMLMAFLVVPAFLVVYLVCGRGRLAHRVLHLAAPAGALAATSGWWFALVSLWPDSTRPYVGGTTSNSWFGLIGGRTGGYLGSTGSVSHMSGDPGLLRIFNTALGGQIAWLLPLGLAGLVAGLWATRRAARMDKLRAGYLLWGLWAVVMIAVFGFVQGTFHSYYTVALAPAVAALAGAGSMELWRLSRGRRWSAWLLPVVVLGGAAWSAVLLGRVSDYAPRLAISVIVLGAVGAAALFLAGWRPRTSPPARSRVGWAGRVSAAGVTAVCLAALLAGPLAYDLSTISRSVTGNSAAAGPGTTAPSSVATGVAKPGESLTTASESENELGVDEALIAYLQEHQGDATYLVAVQTSSVSVPLILATGEPVATIGGYKSRDPVPTASQLEELVARGQLHYVLLAADGAPGSVSSGEGSDSTKAVLQAAVDWVRQHGSVVPAEQYGAGTEGTLYYLE